MAQSNTATKELLEKQLRVLTHPAFVRNDGQITDLDGNRLPNVRYLLNANGMKVQLRPNGFSYDTWVDMPRAPRSASGRRSPGMNRGADAEEESDKEEMRYHRVDITFSGANPNPVIEAFDPVENVFIVQPADNAIAQLASLGHRTLCIL